MLEKKNEESRKSYVKVLKGKNHGQLEFKKTIEDTSSRSEKNKRSHEVINIKERKRT